MTSQSTPHWCVIVVTYNSAATILPCLAPVMETPEAEIIIVDNNSTDATRTLVAHNFPRVHFIELPENIGFGAACNVGMTSSKEPIVLLLNPDTVASPEDLRTLVNFLKEHPDAGITGARLKDQSGQALQSMGDFPSLFGLVLDKPLAVLARVGQRKGALRRLLGALSAKYRLPGSPQRVAWVSGAAFCLRRRVWEQLGGFDENFFMYYEDVDFCRRAGKLGWEVWHLPSAIITHRSGASWQGNNGLKRKLYYHSRRYYFQKHSDPLTPIVLRLLEMIYRVTRGYRWFSKDIVAPPQRKN